ncbi:4'-phosphopantetheinyl transferase [Rheinheimera sp.]|uniref:4'-phosphopantetheinyl transferase n=1 Tax=Rheinheimera sp. TaxID=1869214 RepID=UPI0037CB8ED3
MNQFIQHIHKKNIPGFPGECLQCTFNTSMYSDAIAENLLGAKLDDSLNRSVNKRKAEYVAGRFLARMGLESLGSDQHTVFTNPDRSPLWPQAYLGSISHANGVAICAVSKQVHTKHVGIDIETVLEPKIAAELAASILVDSEIPLVGSLTNPNAEMLTLVFSAKESLYKALYPEVGRFFGFESARILDLDFASGTFQIELTTSLSALLPEQTCFAGQFECGNGRLFTFIADSISY